MPLGGTSTDGHYSSQQRKESPPDSWPEKANRSPWPLGFARGAVRGLVFVFLYLVQGELLFGREDHVMAAVDREVDESGEEP